MNVDLLKQHFETVLTPENNIVVTGALQAENVDILQQAGVEWVINLQPDEELTFDEKQTIEQVGINYTQIPIKGAEDLKQTVIMQFDQAIRHAQGKQTLIHCKSGNRVGAVVALRAGWLRGRKIDTAIERGKAYGLTGLEQEVHNRLLVPR